MATRDLPHSFNELLTGWYKRIPGEVTIFKSKQELIDEDEPLDSDDEVVTKVQFKTLWPAFISGAGLFSDGYVNNGIGTVLSCLKIIYGDEFTQSRAISNIASIAFVGTVVGQVSFGFISDHYDRKAGMLAANIMLIIFTLLCAVGSWGKTTQGFFACLTVWRFFLGIAIGAEYPTSSVIASEFANQLPSGHRNRYFAWFTNCMIDFGFVVSSFVPLVLLWIFSTHHLRAVWRLSIGLGVVPPLFLFFFRLKMANSNNFKKTNMRRVKAREYPWWLIIKFYWFRLLVVALIWFIYDFSVYSFGTFNTIIIGEVIKDNSLYKNWGWSVVFNLFYMPGTIIGALFADYFGPRLTLVVGLLCQVIIGFAMSARLNDLKQHVAGFVVVFGFFSTFGEFGPGNTCGLFASKTSATAIRGKFYGLAACIAKIGAFIGTYVFPAIQKRYSYDADLQLQVPFYVSASLCLFSAFLALFCLPDVSQNAINKEDIVFMQYLRDNGFDTQLMGDAGEVSEIQKDTQVPISDSDSLDKDRKYNVDENSV